MYAIISKLDPDSSSTVNTLWLKLCETCGLQAIYNIPTPHFTWLLAEDVDHKKVTPLVSQIADRADAMTLHTFGLGIFSGEHPVLYLPMVKSREMITLHEKIWNQIQPLTKDSKLYYSPSLWVPHITLALDDLTRENLPCAVNAIAFDPIELFIQIDNLAIAEHTDEKPGRILEHFDFSD